MATTSDRAQTGRSAAKRHAITTAAREVFLHHGYGAASVDEIAARAGVSKVTIYKNFTDKHTLFSAVLVESIDETTRKGEAELSALAETDDLAHDLLEVARELLANLLDPDVVRMRRILVGEAERFPELARLWHERGPEQSHRVLGEVFVTLADRGLLRVDDGRLAAAHFEWLVLAVPMNAAMFGVVEHDPNALERYAKAGVAAFLTGYGQPT